MIKPHRAGLFSLINNLITCLFLYRRAHVDWSSGSLYGTPEDGNVWDHLFKPTVPPDSIFDIIEDYPDQWLTFNNVAKLYRSPGAWRNACWKQWQKIHVQPEIKEGATDWFEWNAPKGCISALIRADGHADEQITGRNQTLSEYARAIEENIGCGKVFIMTGDRQTLEWFKVRFPVIFYPDTIRSESRAIDRHLVAPQTIQDAKNCLTEVLILAKMDALIHPVSNMATSALYINPALKSIYLP